MPDDCAPPLPSATVRAYFLMVLAVAAQAAPVLSTATPRRSPCWLGATDLAQDGVWQWVEATPWSFTIGGAGEPNNAGAAEH